MSTVIDRPRTTSAPETSPSVGFVPTTPTTRVRAFADVALDRVGEALAAHSITVLRVSLGVVFLVFASFKFVSGASPAEDLAVATVDQLTFGMVSGDAALLMTALMETFIGLTLLSGRFLRLGLLVLAGALAGIMSPLVLFPDQMWADNGPTLMGQYVVKDIVLVAGALVVAAHALGARLQRTL
jgi:putative oxidoreductase